MKAWPWLLLGAFALGASSPKKEKKPKRIVLPPDKIKINEPQREPSPPEPISRPTRPPALPSGQRPDPIRPVPQSKPKQKPVDKERQRQKQEAFNQKIDHFVNELKAAATRMKKAREAEIRKTNFPFVYPKEASLDYIRASLEYQSYLNGTLKPERYPVSPWEVGEDYELVKMNPGRWVLLKFEQPKLLSEVLESYAPSWAAVKFTGIGLAVVVAPEVLAYFGVESVATYTALQVSQLAFQIASVIKASAEGTGATVAEIAYQVYSIQSPGLALGLGELVRFQLNAWGLKMVVKKGVESITE